MAATIEFDYFGASATEPAGVSAEAGWKMNREDTQSGTTPIPIPTALGQNFSWYKQFALKVTVAGGSLSNFTIKMNSAPTAGCREWWKSAATYVQASGANKPADDATANGNAPTGYTAVSQTAQQWYAGPISGGTTGRKGDFLLIALGIGYDYTGGGNSNLALPNMTATYDEA